MLELKGKALERLSAAKREKMEKTLERMREVRRRKDMRLAKLIKGKKQWAEKERQKGIDIIDQLNLQIKQIKEQQDVIREQIKTLDGCLLVLNELDEEAENMLKEDNKQENNTEDK